MDFSLDNEFFGKNVVIMILIFIFILQNTILGT